MNEIERHVCSAYGPLVILWDTCVSFVHFYFQLFSLYLLIHKSSLHMLNINLSDMCITDL